MKIEIWSEVICPFCYIGKRNIETAIEQFHEKENIEIVWKSFLIDPSIPEIPKDSYRDHLVNRKGMSKVQVDTMLTNITQSAKNVGLDFDFAKNILVNSRNAHKLIQYAKSKGLAHEMEESLFRAFFSEGKNTADIKTLTELGVAIGLEENLLKAIFNDDTISLMIDKDVAEGRNVGVSGVPFFVFDRKYAVSGAQSPEVLLTTMQKAFQEWRTLNPKNDLQELPGNTCSVDGTCN